MCICIHDIIWDREKKLFKYFFSIINNVYNLYMLYIHMLFYIGFIQFDI